MRRGAWLKVRLGPVFCRTPQKDRHTLVGFDFSLSCSGLLYELVEMMRTTHIDIEMLIADIVVIVMAQPHIKCRFQYQ